MDRDKIEKFLTIASGKKVPKWQIEVLIKMREYIKRTRGEKSSEYRK